MFSNKADKDVADKPQAQQPKVHPLCYSCKKLIVIESQTVIALARTYHDHCFTCTSCRKKLTKDYSNIEGKPYCSSCDTKVKVGRCNVCNKDIESEFVEVAPNVRLHPDCFRCGQCKQAIDSAEFAESEDGKTYFCARCDAPVCDGCGKSVGDDDFCRVSDRAYHPNCLRCTDCKKPLDVRAGFAEISDKFYCDPCAGAIVEKAKAGVGQGQENSARCSVCHSAFNETEPIVQGLTQNDNRKWHLACFRCGMCGNVLNAAQESSFSQKDGQLLCSDCSLSCSGCGKELGPSQISAAGSHWHPQCFVCSDCSSPLTKEYFEVGDRPVCGTCYPKASKQITCAKCNKAVGNAPHIDALNKVWHKECFECDNCSKKLSTEFMNFEDTPLCNQCFDTIALPANEKCGGCNMLMQGKRINAIGKRWHPECFKCYDCHEDLDEGYVEKEGLPYCQRCFNAAAILEACSSCNKPLGAQRFTAFGKKYHKSCFNCVKCKTFLSGGFKEHESGGLICENCLRAASAEVCGGCAKPILDGKRINALNKKWHSACFVCSQCKNPVSGDFYQREGQPLCGVCVKSGRTLTPQTSNLEPCGKCGKPFTDGKRLQALGKKWHQGCFVCTKCSSALQDFMDSEGSPYCTKCFGTLAPKNAPTTTKPAATESVSDQLCSACNKTLGAKRVAAMGKKWHSDCFVCQACKKALSGTYYEKNGLPHCGCLDKEYCGGCSKEFTEGKRLTALGKKFHPNCFVCKKCHGALTSGYFASATNDPYCQACSKHAK